MGWDTQGPWQWWLVLAGWSALVVFWHSTLVTLLFAAWRAVHPGASPRRHHASAMAAIAIALALAALTPTLLAQRASRPQAPRAPSGRFEGQAGLPSVGPATLRWTATASAVATAPRVRVAMWWVGAAWVAGCAVLLLRVLWGLAAVRWIRVRATPATSDAVVDAVAATCAAWCLPYPKVLTSSSLEAPVALGVRSPVVILPRCAEECLPIDALTPLIAHELAHVARRDYAVNLAQSLADAVLFFSPGVRWVSRCAREAREFCCDDLAVDRCGGPGTYARALVLLAGLGVTTPSRLAIGATGPRLVVRIRRLLQEESMARHPRRHFAVVAALFVLAAAGGRSLVAASIAGVTPVAAVAPVASLAAQPEGPARTDPPAVETTVPIPYPDDARVAGVQGPVVLSVTTDVMGQPTSVEAVAGEPLLTPGAVDAVGQWRFAPSEVPRAFMLAVNVVPRDPSLHQATAAALRVGGTVRPPNKVYNVNPSYPGEARDAGVQGVVIMQARIGADGIVDSATVVRSVPALDAAALYAVAQWQYTPTLLNGAPVPVLMTVTVNFTLQQ